MSFPKWFEKDGVKKLFSEEPREIGWEPCSGHYDFMRGIWVEDEPKKAEKSSLIQDHLGDDSLKALRAEYQRLAGKKPFMGWDAEKLYEKIEAL